MTWFASPSIHPSAVVVPPLSRRRSTRTELRAESADDGSSSSVVASSRHAPSQFVLSRWQYTLVWVAYVVISTLNAALALVFAGIYYAALIIRGGYMIDSVGLITLDYIPIVSGSYAVLAVYFGKVTCQAIFSSICSRSLVFGFPSRSSPAQPLRRWRQRLNKIFPRDPSFEVVFLVREVIEVLTQSYQAYKCSTLISMQWINNFYVATLAVNCWASPVIHARAGHNRSLQRFLYISSDILLDFASTFVVPVSIIFTIVLSAFQDNLGSMSGDMDYAFDVPMDDVKFSNMVKAVQQVFVVTWLDFFTKMLPFVSMASCLKLIQPDRNRTLSWKQSRVSRRHLVADVAPEKLASPAAPQQQQLPTEHRKINRWTLFPKRSWKVMFSVHTVHAIFAIWGVCIVVFHIQAHYVATLNTVTHSIGCKTRSQPWFVEKYSCTVLEINCHRRGITGAAEEIASALRHVDAKGVGSLLISHCPRLHIPPELQSLRNLMWLEIFNVTLMQWDEESALVNTKLPALQYLNLIRVNTSDFPMGLQSSNFPSRLRDVTITLSNITTLPSDLHTKWKRMVNLVLEHNGMESIPSTLQIMNPSRLSLFDNKITAIPDGFFTHDASFWILSIAKNPITEWPATIGTLDRTYLVLMDYTEIQELPRWLTDEGERRAKTNEAELTVSAGGSRYCRTYGAQMVAGLKIVCREKTDIEVEAYVAGYYQPIRVP